MRNTQKISDLFECSFAEIKVFRSQLNRNAYYAGRVIAGTLLVVKEPFALTFSACCFIVTRS